MLSKPSRLLTRLVFPSQCHQCGNLLFLHEQSVCQICLDHLPRTTHLLNHQLQPLGATIGASFSAALSFDGEVQILCYADRKSTRLNSSHPPESRMPSSA